MRWITLLALIAGCSEELPNTCDYTLHEATGAIDPDEQDPVVLQAIAECQQQGRCIDVCGYVLASQLPGSFYVVTCEPLDTAPPTRFHVTGREICVD